jgi:hypothetical protein
MVKDFNVMVNNLLTGLVLFFGKGSGKDRHGEAHTVFNFVYENEKFLIFNPSA